MLYSKEIPDLVIEKILFYLDTRSIVMLSRASQTCNKICNRNIFWKEISIDISNVCNTMHSFEKLLIRYSSVLKVFKIKQDKIKDARTVREVIKSTSPSDLPPLSFSLDLSALSEALSLF